MALLISGLIIFGGVIYIVKTKENVSTNTIRLIITILILNYVVLLVVAGYDNNQIAPVISLLGTIAGYLLGRTDKDIYKDGINDIKNSLTSNKNKTKDK